MLSLLLVEDHRKSLLFTFEKNNSGDTLGLRDQKGAYHRRKPFDLTFEAALG